jgi:hypothetical protein
MLLESLLACTPLDESAAVLQPHPIISSALELVSGVATYMNEKKRESEGQQQLLYVRSPFQFGRPRGTYALIGIVARSDRQ